MVRSVICGMDTDAQGGVGITIPGLVKIHLEKIVSKMTPTLKLFLLWEEGLTRSPPQGLTTQFFPRFCEIIYIHICIYVHTHIKVVENILPYGLLLAHSFKVLNTQVK